MIVLLPDAGLCNRMRAIDSAIALSQAMGKKLHIYWIKNTGINCGFHDLFEPFPPSVATIKNFERKPFYLKDFSSKSKFISYILSHFQRILFGKVIFIEECSSLFKQNFDFKQLKKYDKILIESQSRFFDIEKRSLYNDFKPKPEIRSQIEELVKHFSTDTIGVHIRRADNKKSIENSPLELFIQVMHKEIALNNRTRFFVASDDQAVKSELVTCFGERIILSSLKEANRNTKEGMVNAVVDLYALSRTKKILGSYWSSFSHTASHISDIEEIIVKKEMLPSIYTD